MQNTDTITAVATASGAAGVAMIRISGVDALRIAQQITQAEVTPRVTQFRRFFDADGQELDHGIVLYFPGPRSFTGEDVVEIQGHGGAVLLDMMLARVCELGARLAQAGEFSQRAFLNGKLDLTQAEAIADLIESGSQAAARAALRSLQGVFSDQVHALVASVIELRSYVEASLDFAEEEIDFLADGAVGERLRNLFQETEQILLATEKGRVLNEGMTLAIAGQPNAGKSSLLNHLAGYDAAIVTEIAGTTRDVIREHIALKGVPVRIIDTAGLREAADPVEQEGIRRAWHEIERADRVLHLIDATRGFDAEDKSIQQRLRGLRVKQVFTKADLLEDASAEGFSGSLISTKTGLGIEALIDELTQDYSDYNHEQNTFIARQRHVQALQEAREFLEHALVEFQANQSGELVAEDLRQVQQALNEITGEFTTEDLLGKIFSSFCIGK